MVSSDNTWIILDSGGVVFHVDPEASLRYLTGANGHQVPHLSRARRLQPLQLHGAEMLRRIRYSAGFWEAFECGHVDEDYFLSRLQQFARRKPETMTFEELRMALLLELGTAYETTVALVRELHQANVRVALFTNTNPLHWKALCERAPDVIGLFRTCITSFDLRHRKPDKEAFRACLEILGAVPEQCLFFDDNRDNCTAAQRMG